MMPKKQSTKSVVSFSPMVGVYEILHLNDYTDDEISTCWYSQHEKDLIKVEIRNVMMLMKFQKYSSSSSQNNIICCTRGLESIGNRRDLSSRRVLQKNMSIDVVIDEQQVQFQKNIYNPETIADVYCQHTREAKELAMIMACMDQEFVNTEMRIDIDDNAVIQEDDDDDDVLLTLSRKVFENQISLLRSTGGGCGGSGGRIVSCTTEGCVVGHHHRSVSSNAA